MKIHRTAFSVFLMLISTCILSRNATACVGGEVGPASFTAAPGSSQTQIWTAYAGLAGIGTLDYSISGGSGVFTLSPMGMPYTDSMTFTITFTPGANDTGTVMASLNCPCGRTHELSGTVASSGVASVVPSTVSFTVSPIPATEHLTLAVSGVRSAEIGIYDLLGNPIASSRSTNWKLDVSSLPAGAYIARIVGVSFSGDPFVDSKRIVIER